MTVRLPSIKTLAVIFPKNAAEARKVLEMDREALISAYKVAKRIHQKWLVLPPLSELQLQVLNHIGQFHGVEAVKIDRHYADYLNTGHTYKPTLIYYQGRWRVQDYGTFVERQERYMPKRRTY